MGRVRSKEEIAALKIKSAIHLNENLLCGIHVKTSGPIPRFHDILEIVFIPLMSDYKTSDKIPPLEVRLRPLRSIQLPKTSVKIRRDQMLHYMNTGLDPTVAADLFEDWCQSIGFRRYKKLVPVAHDFADQREFLIEWLGRETYNHYFFPAYRDTLTASMFCNDLYDMRAQYIPYPKLTLGSLCRRMGIDLKPRKKGSALEYANAVVQVYSQMLKEPT